MAALADLSGFFGKIFAASDASSETLSIENDVSWRSYMIYLKSTYFLICLSFDLGFVLDRFLPCKSKEMMALGTDFSAASLQPWLLIDLVSGMLNLFSWEKRDARPL